MIMKNDKIIITFFVALMLTSFVFLASKEKKQQEIKNYDFWELYFIDPKYKSLDFMIENHNSRRNFHWEIIIDKKTLEKGDIELDQNSIWTYDFTPRKIKDKKVIIRVSDGKKEKEIYKNL